MNLQINSIYTFNTLAPAILGAVIKNAKLIFATNLDGAMAYENVRLKYEQIFPALPLGAPKSPVNVVFYYFLTESGQKIIIAEPWIDATTLSSVVNLSFNIDVVNVTEFERQSIISILRNMGIAFTVNN